MIDFWLLLKWEKKKRKTKKCCKFVKSTKWRVAKALSPGPKWHYRLNLAFALQGHPKLDLTEQKGRLRQFAAVGVIINNHTLHTIICRDEQLEN